MVVRLTPAQERLIPYIVNGLTYAAIAHCIGWGIGYVKNETYRIAAKVPPMPNVPTYRRVQLWALSHGYGTQTSLSPEPFGESRSRPLVPPQDH